MKQIERYNVWNTSLKTDWKDSPQVYTYDLQGSTCEGLNGAQYTMLTDLEMIDTLSDPSFVHDMELFMHLLTNIIDAANNFSKLPKNATHNQKQRAGFIWRHILDDNYHNIRKLRANSTSMKLIKLFIDGYCKLDEKQPIFWFANKDDPTSRIQRWFKDLELSIDQTGIGQTEGAGKFFGKFGFHAALDHTRPKTLYRQFVRTFRILNTMNTATFDQSETQFKKLPYFTFFLSKIVIIVQNMVNHWYMQVNRNAQDEEENTQENTQESTQEKTQIM